MLLTPAAALAAPHWSSPVKIAGPADASGISPPQAFVTADGRSLAVFADGLRPALSVGTAAGSFAAPLALGNDATGTAGLDAALGANGTLAVAWTSGGSAHVAVAPAGQRAAAQSDLPGANVERHRRGRRARRHGDRRLPAQAVGQQLPAGGGHCGARGCVRRAGDASHLHAGHRRHRRRGRPRRSRRDRLPAPGAALPRLRDRAAGRCRELRRPADALARRRRRTSRRGSPSRPTARSSPPGPTTAAPPTRCAHRARRRSATPRRSARPAKRPTTSTSRRLRRAARPRHGPPPAP